MPWCHKCKEEYVDGIKTCRVCGEKLSDVPPLKEADFDRDFREVLLYDAKTEVDFALVTNELKKTGVPFRSEEGGIWDYYHILSAHSFAGQRIYIAESDKDRASKILTNLDIIKKANDKD
jgi:hypothetical protein